MPTTNKGSATGASTGTSAETAVITFSPNADAAVYGTVAIEGNFNVTAGSGTTAVTLRVRQGSGTGGTLVGVALPHTLAAGASAQLGFHVEDTAPSASGGHQYTITIQQTGGTGAGTVNYAWAKASTLQGVAA